ncbi:MAG TPA: DNA alkylation repair protein [Alphaproteobacteria bacterium]|nr:DNA alkylation repair protein [Alphaproteobacteria bacterium]
MKTETANLLTWLAAEGSETNRAGMARYGITVDRATGVSVRHLRARVRDLRQEFDKQQRDVLGWSLWASGQHEAQIMASMLIDPESLTRKGMDRIAAGFDSWDVCDGYCNNLFRHSRHAHAAAAAWTRRRAEFVRRAGFALIASLAVHDRDPPKGVFTAHLGRIEGAAGDGRTMVKKAAAWALRRIGRRGPGLARQARTLARRLATDQRPPARWIGRTALRELGSGTG